MKEQLTKQSILLFEKKGFSSTSIQDITNAMNVTKGTFYYYFSSKEQLLMDIHDEYITDLIERQFKISEDELLTQKDKLAEIIFMLINDIPNNGPSARVFFREMRHLVSENRKKIKLKREEFRLNIEEVISEGIAKGEFQESLKADMIAFAVLGIMNWTYNWYNPKGEILIKELSKIYTDLLLRGILTEEQLKEF